MNIRGVIRRSPRPPSALADGAPVVCHGKQLPFRSTDWNASHVLRLQKLLVVVSRGSAAEERLQGSSPLTPNTLERES